MKIDRLSKYLIIPIALFAFFIRFYLLGSVPPGLTNDEADIGYDAYSILVTGKDQWGQTFPLTSFKGFGDYRPPLYTYFIVPSISLFGLNAFSVRFPSALFGGASVFLIFFLAVKLFEKNKSKYGIGLFSAFLLAISPWPLGLSRIGIESNTGITLLLLTILLFIYSLKKPKLFLITAFIASLSLYTYTSYFFFMPIVLLVLSLFYRIAILKHKKYFFTGLLVFILLVFPLFIFRSAGGTRASQVSFINSQDNVGIMANLNDRRGSCQEIFGPVCKLTENKYTLFTKTFIKNYINHFSPSFLYFDGTNTQYSILPPGSLLFTIEIVFLMMGFLYLIKKPSKEGSLLIILFLLSPVPDSITGNGHFSRASEMMPFIFILEGVGAAAILGIKTKIRPAGSIGKIIILSLFIFSSTSFYLSYFSYFPKHFSTFSQYGYEELMQKIFKEKDNYDKIYLSKFNNDTKHYIYYLFYNKIDPEKLREAGYAFYSTDPDGWISVDRIKNIYFTNNLPSEKQLNEEKHLSVLFITHPDEFPENYKSVALIKNKNGDIRFSKTTNSEYLNFLLPYSTQK